MNNETTALTSQFIKIFITNKTKQMSREVRRATKAMQTVTASIFNNPEKLKHFQSLSDEQKKEYLQKRYEQQRTDSRYGRLIIWAVIIAFICYFFEQFQL